MPAYLSDHIIDSQSDDAFLLRDSSTGKVLSFSAIKELIAKQYKAGRYNLARAIEQKAGFVRI